MWEGKKVIKHIEITRFFSAFERLCTPDFLFRGEVHNFWEILYVVKGNVMVSANDRVYSLCEGDIVFHKPMELHKFRGNNEDNFHIFVISFECIGEMIEALNDCALHLTSEQKRYIELLMNFTMENSDCDYGEDLYVDGMKNNTHFSQIFTNLTEIFLMSCIKDSKAVSKQIKNFKTETYKNAVNIMECNVTRNLSIPEIAKKCGVSVSYLKNIFTEYAGTGIHKFFLTLKITHACNLLNEGFTVSEISDILEFSTQNYFSTVFKREIGVSPTEYKKKKRLQNV